MLPDDQLDQGLARRGARQGTVELFIEPSQNVRRKVLLFVFFEVEVEVEV